MSRSEDTLAFLHAHGLPVAPGRLSSALRAAIEAAPAYYYGPPGAEGLTAEEVAVAQAGGLEPMLLRDAEDPLVDGIVAHAALLQTGLTTAQAAKRLGVTDARIRQRLRDRTLLALREGRAWKLPAFQFTARGELPGWAEVCPAVPTMASPVALERWMNLPHPDLRVGPSEERVSPRAWLQQGRAPRAVAELAGELA
jgi:excisionase family DNA binding protein